MSKVVRIYANDGRHYVEKDSTLLEMEEMDEMYGKQIRKLISKKLSKMDEPASPGVPDVIDGLTGRPRGRRNTVEEYRQTILDMKDDGTGSAGKYACPGMNLCRIAAFQDYVSGSNSIRLSTNNTGKKMNSELLHTRNYYCCPDIQDIANDLEKPNSNSAHARIFCCAKGNNLPGMIAMVLNVLNFRLKHERIPAGNTDKDKWLINIDYFNHITCQNSYFTLNRLFGVFVDKLSQPFSQAITELPLHTIRILPIGGVQSARLWYQYAFALYEFLKEAGYSTLKFFWMDENRKKHDASKIPAFNETVRKDYPILLVIKLPMKRNKAGEIDNSMCRICGRQKTQFDCSDFRGWV